MWLASFLIGYREGHLNLLIIKHIHIDTTNIDIRF